MDTLIANHPQATLFRKQMSGGSGILSFELAGGEAAAKRFLDRLNLIVHAVSLGGMEAWSRARRLRVIEE